jgi:hypothetical protein
MPSAKTGTSTTTNQVQFPQYVEQAQEGGLNAATALSMPWLQPQDARIAGFNEDQMMGQDLTRWNARGTQGTDYSRAVTNAAHEGRDSVRGTGVVQGQVMSGGADQIRAAGQGITGADITAMMNPYLDDVGKTTLDNMRREYQNAQAGLDAKFANESSFGGSGAALARARQARDYNQDVGSTISQLRAQGFDRGADLAQFNSNQKFNAAQAGANMDAQSVAARMAAEQAASNFNLLGATGGNAAYNDTVSRNMATTAALDKSGAIQQNLAQAQLDMPYNQMDWLQRYIPGVQPNSSSSQPIYSNPLGTAIGAGLSLGGGLGPSASLFDY